LFKGSDIGTVDRDVWRKRNVGLILQESKLIPYLTALENAAMHMELIGMPQSEYKKTAVGLLEKAGFDIVKCGQKAKRLNPYEQQRVIAARALGLKPPLLLIEEAEWSTDLKLESTLGEMLLDTAHADGACVVIATNSRSLASRADEVWGLKDGVLLPLKTL
jgi:putative ABC transport system ATP-binding protein